MNLFFIKDCFIKKGIRGIKLPGGDLLAFIRCCFENDELEMSDYGSEKVPRISTLSFTLL